MLLDTSGLLCIVDEGERNHQVAIENFEQPRLLLTHSYVLDELVALGTSRGVKRSIVFSFCRRLLDSPSVTVIWVNEDLHRRALELLESRPDKLYSLCDAVSFVLMRDFELHEALTTDRHFSQEGFVRLLDA